MTRADDSSPDSPQTPSDANEVEGFAGLGLFETKHTDTKGTDTKRTDAKRKKPRTRRRKRRAAGTIAVVTVLVLAAAAAYTAAAAGAAVPDPELMLTEPAPQPVAASEEPAQAAVDAQPLPTAIGWAESEGVWSNDEQAYPLASVSKLVTVLVALETRPLAPDSDGETHVWSEEDAAQQAAYLADDGVAYPVPVGTEMTERQMLTLIFLPSANDFADAYARWVFGSNEAFLAAVEAWKQKHGIASLEFVEPTGMDEGNRATPADLVRIARIALANPTVTQFTNVVSAEMPWGIGTIENTNPLLTELPGMVGLKTGRSSSAGFNLVAAQRVDAHGREVTKISVTMGRGSVEERAQSGRDMLAAMDTLPQVVPIVEAGTQVGEAVSVMGDQQPLTAATAASAVLLPGELATLEVALGAGAAGAGAAVSNAAPDQAVPTAATASSDGQADSGAGEVVGSVTISAPASSEVLPVVQTGSFTEPDLWWRVTHPEVLWG
ncbi:D-alanyl-D-alanine carboxypeptidase family protein [Leucobacter sp. HY1910]